ncbi:MAG: PilW family protein [Methylophilaceae bacterium]
MKFNHRVSNNITYTQRSFALKQTGFSLIELLVGLVIGLIVTLVITQLFSVFEGDKRSTMGSADAQTNGNIALYTLTRDIQQAGFGLPGGAATDSIYNCAIANQFSPVTIEDGGLGSDIVTVRYGNSQTGGLPTKVTDQVNDFLMVVNSTGCVAGNVAIQVNSSACTIKNIQVQTGSYDPNTTVQVQNSTGLSPSGNLYCPGQWNEYQYSVKETPTGSKKFELNKVTTQIDGSGTLTPISTTVTTEVVGLKALYGVSTDGDNTIDSWQKGTGSVWGASNLTATTRNQIKAVRIAIATRNALKEKNDVTPNSCMTMYGNDCTTAPAGALQIDISRAGTTTITDWKKYRYRVYEAIIPIRNVVWAGIS